MQKRADPSAQNESQDMIDKSISFDKRDMHGTWPFIKGCLIFGAGLAGFVYLSIYVFKNWKNWF